MYTVNAHLHFSLKTYPIINWAHRITSYAVNKCPYDFLALFSVVGYRHPGYKSQEMPPCPHWLLATRCVCGPHLAPDIVIRAYVWFWHFDHFVFQTEAEAFESPHAASETPLKIHCAVRGIAAWIVSGHSRQHHFCMFSFRCLDHLRQVYRYYCAGGSNMLAPRVSGGPSCLQVAQM